VRVAVLDEVDERAIAVPDRLVESRDEVVREA
jgi:hypothetical protein